MTTIQKETVTFDYGKGKLTIYVKPYTDDKNKFMRGFVDAVITMKNEEGEDKLHSSYSALRVIESPKDGNLFISEPTQKAYKDKEGNITSRPYYLASLAMKQAIVDHLTVIK